MYYDVCSEFLSDTLSRDASPEERTLKSNVRRGFTQFNNLCVRMDMVSTASAIPSIVNAGQPAPPGILNSQALRDAIGTAEYGEYRGNCLYCHRQNWCGASHKTIYCPFRLITMHPGRLKSFMGPLKTEWPPANAAKVWHARGNFLPAE